MRPRQLQEKWADGRVWVDAMDRQNISGKYEIQLNGTVNLPITVAMCSATTVVCFLSYGSLMSSARDIGDLVPTLGWWTAFSFSLYCGDLQWRRFAM